MDPIDSLQDVIRCHLCETPVPQLYCNLCQIDLCKACAGEHILDESKRYDVVPMKEKWNPVFPKCPKHSIKHCDLFCEECDKPICTQCVSSGKHEQHDFFERKLKKIHTELQELEQTLFPKHQKAASDIQVHRDVLKRHYEKLASMLKNYGEALHREIENVIRNLRSKFDEIESKQLYVFERKETEISIKIKDMSQTIFHLKKLLNSRDVRLVSEYKTRLSEFRQLPPQLGTYLPNFTPKSMKTTQLYELFRYVTSFFKGVEDRDNTAMSELQALEKTLTE